MSGRTSTRSPSGPRRVRKSQIVAALDRESRGLLKLLRSLNEERASQPILGEWSARDVVSHCTYWQGTLARLMGAPIPPPHWLSRFTSESELGRDELNRRTVEHYRFVSQELALRDFEFTAGLVREIVMQMKETNLTLPAGAPWDESTLVWEAIASESYLHWQQHAGELSAALRRR